MKRSYQSGLDVLGATTSTNRAVLIRVLNADELARSQGAVAALAQSIAPATIEAKVYDTLASQLKKSLSEKNVKADVSVVEPGAWKPADSKHIWTDVGFAVGGAGLLAALWFLFSGRRR